MTIYVYDRLQEKVVPKHERTDLPRSHYVISDVQPLLKHPVTGRYYDSKSRFRADTKASGCEEVGNEKMESRPVRPDPEKRRASIRQEIERRGITDSHASEIMNSLARMARR